MAHRPAARNELRAVRLILCAALAAAASAASGQDPAAQDAPTGTPPKVEDPAPAPALPRTRPVELAPATLLQLAILQNSDIGFARLQAGVAAQGFEAETGLYQPIGYATVRRDGRSRPRTVEERLTAALGGIPRLEELGKSAEAGVRVRAPTGAEASLSLRSVKRNSNVIGSAPFAQGDAESAGAFVLSVKQPLMRGAGRGVTETDLRVADAEREIGAWQLRQQMLRVGSDALGAYWQLQRAVQAQALRRESLDNARALMEDTRARIAGGRLPAAAMDEADATLAAREAELSRGALAVAEAEARVRVLLDLPPDDGGWRLAAAAPAPASTVSGDLQARLNTAMAAWPPLRIAQLRRAQALDRLKLAQDRLRPNLELQLSYSTNSLTPNGVEAASQALKGRNPDWSMGLMMEMPIGEDRRSQAQARAQQLRLEQSDIEIRAVTQALGSDLVNRAQQLESSQKEVAQVERDLEARRGLMAADELQHRAGSAPLNRLLRRQADVLEAQLRLIDATARLELARIAMQLTEGTLLQAYNVRIED
jgi:outer membrane protein TolC